MKKTSIILIALLILMAAFSGCQVSVPEKETEAAEKTYIPPDLDIVPDVLELTEGETYEIEMELFGTPETVEFESSDPLTASVDETGTVSAIKKGECTITASVGEAVDFLKIRVVGRELVSLKTDPASVSVKAGEETGISVITDPEGYDTSDLVFESFDESIATVDSEGHVKGISVGNTQIAARIGDLEAVAEVSVYADHADSISPVSYFISVKPDEEILLPLRISPSGYVPSDLRWQSNDESIVSVDPAGTLKGISAGMTEISFESEGFKDTITVSVTDKAPLPPLSDPGPASYILGSDGIISDPSKNGEEGSARILLTGDLMCLRSQQLASYENGTYDFNTEYSLAKEIFEKADLVVGNLETCVSFSWPLTAQAKDVGGYPNCNAPATYLDALRYAGIDVCVTANNHCCDAGYLGILETNLMLDRYGLFHTGTFSSEKEDRFIIVNVNGIKVGILSYTEYFNGKNSSLTPFQREININEYSEEKAIRDIKAARDAGAEFVIVYNHWGTENKTSVNGDQQKHAQELADAGADFIAGSHPHVIQRAEYITASDGRRVLCIYSMGNFVSSMGSTENNDTMIMSLTVERDEAGKPVLSEAGFIPGHVYSLCAAFDIEGLTGGHDLSSSSARIARTIGDSIALIKEYN